MSNQIVISSGAKVRELEGVLTGTSGVVNALGINVPSGIPQLDGSGKILVSQLPNSVMEYKGSWNAATNTPTLVNGTGNAGDVYLCEVAGTVNFGAGPITFAVGDQVIYSGAIWQRASGATGTVTSVAVTESGDALTITGSPITTSGTINIGFAGTSGQYVNGAGGLTTFPSLTGFVPYTGATANVDLGTNNIFASFVYAEGAGGSSNGGILIKQYSGALAANSGYTSLFATPNQLGINFGGIYNTFLQSATLTASRTFTLPDVSGQIAILESPFQVFTGTVQIQGQFNTLYGISMQKGSTPPSFSFGDVFIYAASGTANILKIANNTYESTLSFPTSNQTYTFPAITGTLALLEGTQIFSGLKSFDTGLLLKNGFTPTTSGYLGIGSGTNGINISLGAGGGGSLIFQSTSYTYTFPAANGTIALTSNLSAYLPLTGGTLTGALIGTTATFSGTVSSIVTSGGTSFRVVNSVNSRAWSLVPSTNGAESDLWLYYGGTGTGTKVSFVNNGNVLIGSTTDSGELLQVNGTSKFTGALSGTTGSFASSGGSDTFAINHSSGSGIALNITKGGNGEGLIINKTSGTGNALSVTGTTSLGGALSGTSATFTGGVTSTLGYSNTSDLGFVASGNIPGINFRSSSGGRLSIMTGYIGADISSILVGTGTNNPTTESIRFNHSTNSINVFGAATFSSSVQTTDLRYSGSGYITWNTNGSGSENLIFRQDATERMRITSGGYLKASNNGTYLNATGPYYELRQSANDEWIAILTNTSVSPYGPSVRFSTAPNNTSNWIYHSLDSSAERFKVASNGGIYNYQANNVNLSDINTKKEIIPLDSYWDKFKAIEIVKFKYKDQTHDDFNIGVIAQQVESVAPEFVDTDMWTLEDEQVERKAIYTSDLHHATIKVLQECMAKIEEQQAQIEELKAMIAAK